MNLEVELLDFDHLDNEESFESGRLTGELNRFRNLGLQTPDDVHQAMSDYHAISTVLESMKTSGYVSRENALSLESLRPRFPELDSFFSDNPVAMYTTESSTVMYEESFENWITTSIKALWNLLKALGHWIVGVIKALWEFLASKTVDSRKADAKLSAFGDIADFLNSANRQENEGKDYHAVLRAKRNVTLQTLSKVYKGYNVAYLNESRRYDRLIEGFALSMIESLGILNNEIAGLVNGLLAANVENDVAVLKAKYEDASKRNLVFGYLYNALRPLTEQMSTMPVSRLLVDKSIDEQTTALQQNLSLLAISAENSGTAVINPKDFNDIIAKGVDNFEAIKGNVKLAIERDLPEMAKLAATTIKQMTSQMPNNVEVRDAIINQRLGDVIGTYNRRVTLIKTLQGRLGWMMDVRNRTIDTLVTASLFEVKEIAKAVDEISDKVSLGAQASIKRNFDRVKTRVINAKIA